MHWTKQNKILIGTVDKKLFKDKFTSMKAIKLINGDDLGKTKIQRGQQKLNLASVNKCLDLQKRLVINAPPQQQQADDIEETPNQNEAELMKAHEQPSDKSDPTGNWKQKQQQEGSAHE